jgi:exosortase A
VELSAAAELPVPPRKDPEVLGVTTWRQAGIVVTVCLLGLLAIYWETASSIVTWWGENPFGHGYIVLPASLFLTWRQRDRLRTLRPSPSIVALGLLAVMSFLWLVGNVSSTNVVQQLCLVIMLAGFVWAVLGLQALRALLFPLGLLLFALPLADRFVPILQDFAARCAVEMLRIVGVPVLLEGHVIAIPGSRWEVAKACSGINYVITSLAVGYVYAGLIYRSWRNRLGFVLASAVLPVVANGFRVFTTILIASWGYTGVAAGLEHELYGVIVFAVITYVLLATCGGWSDASDAAVVYRQGPAARGEAPPWQMVAVAMAGGLIVVVAPLSARQLAVGPAGASISPYVLRTSGSWSETSRDRLSWKPVYAAPASETVQSFVRPSDGGGERYVKLAMGYVSAAQRGAKLSTNENLLFESPWWLAGSRTVQATIEGRRVRIREKLLRSTGGAMRLWTWYRIDSVSTGNDYAAKLLFAQSRLSRSLDGAAIVTVATRDDDETDASAVLVDFVRSLTFSRDDRQ